MQLFCTWQRFFKNLLPQNAPLILKIQLNLSNENNVYSCRGNRHIFFLYIFTGYLYKTQKQVFFNHPVYYSTLHLINFRYMEPLITKACKQADKVRALCYNHRTQEIAVISPNSYIHCWNALTMKQVIVHATAILFYINEGA